MGLVSNNIGATLCLHDIATLDVPAPRAEPRHAHCCQVRSRAIITCLDQTVVELVLVPAIFIIIIELVLMRIHGRLLDSYFIRVMVGRKIFGRFMT